MTKDYVVDILPPFYNTLLLHLCMIIPHTENFKTEQNQITLYHTLNDAWSTVIIHSKRRGAPSTRLAGIPFGSWKWRWDLMFTTVRFRTFWDCSSMAEEKKQNTTDLYTGVAPHSCCARVVRAFGCVEECLESWKERQFIKFEQEEVVHWYIQK